MNARMRVPRYQKPPSFGKSLTPHFLIRGKRDCGSFEIKVILTFFIKNDKMTNLVSINRDMAINAVILPIQKTSYTCGPACLAAVAALTCNAAWEELNLVDILETNADIGTTRENMYDFACAHLPVQTCGTNVYEGGLGIAFIMDLFEPDETAREEHYVLLLGRENGYIRFYCPYQGDVYVCPQGQFLWHNRDSSVKNWALSFDCADNPAFLSVEGTERHILIEE